MSNEDQEETSVDDDLKELMRLVEFLDKAAANVRQLIYKLRPVLREEIQADDGSSRSDGTRRRQGQRERSQRS